ncbi:DNA-binding protein, partial [Acidobacteria bacterium AH-259-D05]|nr:DNA-binding protein [Acidobacteria bacterium AH-259-D05]
DETVTLLRFKVSHSQALVFLDFVGKSVNVTQVQVTDELVAQAEEIFRTYKDKRWSFTDCVSFAFMDEMELKDAFSFDQNFAQYGKTLHP